MANTPENARASNGRRHRKKHKKNNTILYVLLMIFVLGAGIYLTFNVFFKVESFAVSGSDKYSTNQVLQATQVNLGDNLFKIDTKVVAGRITAALPYIESAKVSRKLPSELTIELTEATVIGAVKTGDTYCLISHGGKILETGAKDPPAGAAVVSGLELTSPEVGKYLNEGEDSTRIQILNQLIASLTQFEMVDDVTLIDVSDALNLYLTYKNAIKIELGSKAEIPYKISFVKKVLEQENIENQEGLIDASGAVDEDKPNVRFRAGDFDEIMGYVTTPPVTTSAPPASSGEGSTGSGGPEGDSNTPEPQAPAETPSTPQQ
ncbi:cell division protein FtsQ/DivIB [Zongyangia hominis]|uniref:FtsQ-type POTRA domain-containing protein n=1 Tax=Zongyangia hominis TaxID=2763677 RepID=A0A926I6J0_9FIRM|nr:FtsQ-type POTRA domain-containing protein [Zongyangia hominis]MBC8570104.1 FtsQ-type POTRA domain-containing protein [Zongyangia hominis]